MHIAFRALPTAHRTQECVRCKYNSSPDSPPRVRATQVQARHRRRIRADTGDHLCIPSPARAVGSCICKALTLRRGAGRVARVSGATSGSSRRRAARPGNARVPARQCCECPFRQFQPAEGAARCVPQNAPLPTDVDSRVIGLSVHANRSCAVLARPNGFSTDEVCRGDGQVDPVITGPCFRL